MQNSRIMTARRIWLKIHLYLGLWAGLVFVLLGLTGSLLVFDHAIDEWLNPSLLRTANAGAHRPLEEIAAAAARACPDLPPPDFLMLPRRPGGVYTVFFAGPAGSDDSYRVEVTVDPVTGEVLGRRVWGEYLMSWIYKLHYTLHLAALGETVVGLTGFLLMASVATGAYLWWPILRRGGLRRSLRIKRSHLAFDLHKIVGSASALVLVVLAFTGAYMIFPEWFKPALAVVSTETPYPADLRSRARPGTAAIRVDEAVAIAAHVFPDARLKGVQLPRGPEGVFVITMRRPGEVRRSWGASRAWIDQYGGEVLVVRDGLDQTFADTFIAWQFPLHSGEAFGLAGRWVVCGAGLTPALLYATGLRLWWRKRRSRGRQQARKAHRRLRPALAQSEAG